MPVRYRLRTLVIAAIFGPPILAFMWFAAVWARVALPPLFASLPDYLFLPGTIGVVALFVYSLVAPSPDAKPAASLDLWQYVLLWICQFLAEWHWLLLVIRVVGWIFIWGDRGPPVEDAMLAALAGMVAATGASITSFRIARCDVTVAYVITIICFTGPLLSIAALYCIGRWLR
jgi:hypothetical protein